MYTNNNNNNNYLTENNRQIINTVSQVDNASKPNSTVKVAMERVVN